MADPTLEEFRDEVTAFLDANAERKPETRADQKFVWGEGGDDVAVLEEKPRDVELAELAEAKVWKAKRYDAGFGWITGPSQYGGRELPVAYDRAYASLEGNYLIPSQSLFGIGLGMVAPTILAHATEKVKDLYLAKLYRGRPRGLAAVQRARRRLRPGRPPDQGRPRRRRVDRQRPEGLDLRRPLQRHRRGHLPDRPGSAQAPGPHRLRGRHAGPRCGDPAAAPDDRRRVLQRGLLHRRPHPRRPPPRRRRPGLGRRPDHPDERAGLHRRAAAARAWAWPTAPA